MGSPDSQQGQGFGPLPPVEQALDRLMDDLTQEQLAVLLNPSDLDGTLVVPGPDCPNAQAHTPHPYGLEQHQAWIRERRYPRWLLIPCGDCRRRVIWIEL